MAPCNVVTPTKGVYKEGFLFRREIVVNKSHSLKNERKALFLCMRLELDVTAEKEKEIRNKVTQRTTGAS